MNELKVVFMGTPELSVNVLQTLIDNTNVVLVVSQPDSYVGRKRILTPSPVSLLAEKYNIPVIKPNKIKDEVESILRYEPDIIITFAYGQIIPESILKYPKFGCINVHASLLPEYRGASPINAVLRDGKTKTGITIMYMDKTLDTGDIISTMEVEISDDDNVSSLSDKLSVVGSELLIKTLPSIIDGTNERLPQDESGATYVGIIKREDERINFNQPAKNVYNFIRSLNPKPLANTIINGEEWKIVEASIGNKKTGEIGVITRVDKKSFSIQCQDGEIIITKVKPAGKKEMNVSDLFNGINKDKLLGTKVGDDNV